MMVLFLRRKSCFDRALKFDFDFDMHSFTNFLETALINAVMEGETESQTKGVEEFLIQVPGPKKEYCSLDAVVYRVEIGNDIPEVAPERDLFIDKGPVFILGEDGSEQGDVVYKVFGDCDIDIFHAKKV